MKASLLFLTLISGISFSAFAQNQHQASTGAFKNIPAGFKGNNPNNGVSEADWLNQAQAYIQQRAFSFKPFSATSFTCANTNQKVVYQVGSNGYSVTPIRYTNMPNASWKSGFALSAIGKGGAAYHVSAHPATTVEAGHLVQQHLHFSIEYINSTAGLRQNFIINEAPVGKKDLRVSMTLKNAGLTVKILNKQLVTLSDNKGNTILQYDELKVWDANHQPLQAHMEMTAKETMAIVVNDRHAVYPVTIDPLNHSAEWTGTAQGILPSVIGQLAIDAAYGYSVAGVGDVNGDGFDDVAIGAPGLADVISGSGSLSAVGAVFVYYGSANGLSVTPGAELQPGTAVTGAMFGFSVAGGDTNGDHKSDIIVGAPLDKVTISTGGSSTASGTVGKVYVFSGANLNGMVTSPLLTLQLSGAGILENGANLSVNALFGFSVAVTDDLNKDGLNDIIVGAPTYAGVTANLFGQHIADVQSGGAFLFLTNNSGGFNMQQLAAPTQSLLGLGILNSNINGLLFGISVDGAGDYNNDGKKDVVVGAPAGVGLFTGKLLQGSAMVYYGNGAGTQSQPGVTLAASSGGLLTNLTGTIANLANLFGYCVKGVKDTSGARTGAILVGAPLGGTLTNLLGGLQVKTGTVSVFKQNTGASGTIGPDQQLSSPRNNNTVLGLIQSSLLFGFSIDNVYDVNCDGIADIIIGEPASSGTQLISANVAGGSAYVFFGKADGTYQSGPGWTLGATYDATLGVNAASLIGYSVAGAHKVKGSSGTNKILVGTPARTLDFGTGLLNLGNTLGTVFGLAAGNNSVGKAYLFDTQLCSVIGTLPLYITNFDAVAVNNSKVLVSWKVSTERNINAYTIERSTNGVTWEVFGIIPGDPTADTTANFSVTDNHPYNGISYYRVKQEDLDNGVFYTNIKAVNLNNSIAGSMKVTNPFYSFIVVQLNSSQDNTAMVDLFDGAGKLVHHQETRVNEGLNTIQINNLSKLAKGVYVLRIINGNEHYTSKLIKE